MAEHVIKLPDVGEGVAEAELVEWHVKVGDLVREDALLAAVMTDKATVEIPSPVDGEISWLGAEIGDTVPVGSPIVRILIEGAALADRIVEATPGKSDVADAAAEPMDDGADEAPVADGMAQERETVPRPPAAKVAKIGQAQNAVETRQAARASKGADSAGKTPVVRTSAPSIGMPRTAGEKPLASPAVRLRAREAGIDLRQVHGSGPSGRIGHDDLDAFLSGSAEDAGTGTVQALTAIEEIKIVGLRRKIADKMVLSASRIPHITYVEEVDITALEDLRAALNKEKRADRPKLTILPFLMRAMVKALGEQPGINALFDDEAGILRRYAGVHLGIATQTPAGLMVPVLRHAEARDIWDCAAEISRLADAAKAGTAAREELAGSTITITSLGAMGGIVTTPIINHPEVAIVGVNKIMTRPVWDGAQFVPRKMMNLSSSFDHRVVDGWDAAVFVQRLKTLLETPALIFVEK